MNAFEQRIYNLYLKTVRSRNNLPFKYRQDFSNFEQNPEYVFVQKINNFFVKFPHIVPEDFFNAPYDIYNDIGHLDLKFYASQKAIGLWSLAQKKKQNQNPDEIGQIDFMIKSMKFISQFCIENKIKLKDYMQNNNACNIPMCAIHFKNKEVSIYALIAIGDVEEIIKKMDEEQFRMFFEDLDVVTFKIRFHQSETMKRGALEAVRRIEKYIDENVSL